MAGCLPDDHAILQHLHHIAVGTEAAAGLLGMHEHPLKEKFGCGDLGSLTWFDDQHFTVFCAVSTCG